MPPVPPSAVLAERVRAHLVETGVLEQLRGVISSAVGTDTDGHGHVVHDCVA